MEILLYLKALFKNNSFLLQIIAIIPTSIFIIKKVSIILNRSKFDVLFLTKDQKMWNRGMQLTIYLLFFNIFVACWGFFSAQSIKISNSQHFVYNSVLIILLVFLITYLSIGLIMILHPIYDLVFKKIKKKEPNIYLKSLTYINMYSAYFSFLFLDFVLFKPPTPLNTSNIISLIPQIIIPTLFSGFYFFTLRGIFNSFYLSSKKATSFIINLPAPIDKKLYVLHAIEKNLIVLGDESSELLSNKLYIYDRDKKELQEFIKESQKSNEETEITKPKNTLESKYFNIDIY
ncbi:hypothetical protein EHS13_13480 [Paenibacillus psychroresistens]|uniref:Uncharacterized protein n=1 Tax=Paenibacillus psychroresistens TaxID=1778678 RepID=A0A6B8RJM3_9BACL|nr:hypothetical protein [Paenibacillus psychroresistens]QGQ95815.1 hypothetical protein EHS13_13480 [Paenibacillus psychroresistens]